jgi:hypothetical protein
MSGLLSAGAALLSSAAAVGGTVAGLAGGGSELGGLLILGPVPFTDWQVPAKVPIGGEQALKVHKQPGGSRVIDAMGRDDMDLSWEGTFTDVAGYATARLLDVLRAAGSPLLLSFDTFSYQVVIRQFTADFERENWIPYRITCAVIQDNAAALISQGLDLLSSAVGDVDSALGFAGGL